MIIKEKIHDNLERFYSSSGLKIKKKGTDEIYDDAIELVSLGVEYEETDIPIDIEPETVEYVTAAKILLGEEEDQV